MNNLFLIWNENIIQNIEFDMKNVFGKETEVESVQKNRPFQGNNYNKLL
jgi:hypothetical protein